MEQDGTKECEDVPELTKMDTEEEDIESQEEGENLFLEYNASYHIWFRKGQGTQNSYHHY